MKLINTHYFTGDRKISLATNKDNGNVCLQVHKPNGSSDVDFNLEFSNAKSCESVAELMQTALHYMAGVEAGRKQVAKELREAVTTGGDDSEEHH